MKRVLVATSITLILLTACASAPTGTSAPTATSLPTLTPLPTATSLPTSTSTSTSTPTAIATPLPTATATSVPKAAVSGLNNDQRPALNLANQVIEPYAKAVGIKQETVKLVGKELKDKKGNSYLVAFASNTGDPSTDGVPLLLATQKEGAWQWRPSGLDALGKTIGLPFGVNLWYKDNAGRVIVDKRYDQIIRNDFSLATLSAGVAWKWLERTPGVLDNWSLSDMSGQLQQARSFENIKGLRLHTLVWQEHYPDWLSNLSAQDANNAMLRHIEFLADRYKGVVQEVNVVNEPYYSGPLFTGKGNFTRSDVLYEKLDQNYLIAAFAKARERFGTDVKLIYNDTANHSLIYGPNGGYTGLTQKNVALLSQQGLIDYVGMQTHIDAKYPPSEDEIIQAIKSYGIPVVITELDVRVDNLPADVPKLERQKIQAQIYAQVIRAAIKSGNVKEISIGEAGDKYSWFVQYMNSPLAYATPFDDEFNPKISYYAMLKELLDQLLLIQ
jgi:GH35 family endo-1,4-beta-xylanase